MHSRMRFQRLEVRARSRRQGLHTLETTDKAALATLDKQAGAKATVTGTEKDNTITVSSVKAAQ